VIGSLYALPAILTLFGIKRSRIRQLGTFGMFIAFMFSSLLRLLTFGWFPLLWLYPLALALIAGVVYLQEFRRDEHGGPNG
jgi:ABC-type transport system involved in cytochrome c biogenesis permease subunit